MSSAGDSNLAGGARRQDEEHNEKESYLVHLHDFWTKQLSSIESTDFKRLRHVLPLARIKKIMKSDGDVRMISAEAPVLFAKACELFILDLTMRGWAFSQLQKRRTLQRADIMHAISSSQLLEFLVDALPKIASGAQEREEDDDEEDVDDDDEDEDEEEDSHKRKKSKTAQRNSNEQTASRASAGSDGAVDGAQKSTKKTSKLKKQKSDSSSASALSPNSHAINTYNHFPSMPAAANATASVNSHPSSDEHFSNFPSAAPSFALNALNHPAVLDGRAQQQAAGSGGNVVNGNGNSAPQHGGGIAQLQHNQAVVHNPAFASAFLSQNFPAAAQPPPASQLPNSLTSPPSSSALPTSLLDLAAPNAPLTFNPQAQTQQQAFLSPPWR